MFGDFQDSIYCPNGNTMKPNKYQGSYVLNRGLPSWRFVVTTLFTSGFVDWLCCIYIYTHHIIYIYIYLCAHVIDLYFAFHSAVLQWIKQCNAAGRGKGFTGFTAKPTVTSGAHGLGSRWHHFEFIMLHHDYHLVNVYIANWKIICFFI